MDKLKKAFKNGVSFNTPNNLDDLKASLFFEKPKRQFWSLRLTQLSLVAILMVFAISISLIVVSKQSEDLSINLDDNVAFGYHRVGAIPLSNPSINERFVKKLYFNGRDYSHEISSFITFFNELNLVKTDLAENETLEMLMDNVNVITLNVSYFTYSIYFTSFDKVIISHQHYCYLYELVDADEIWYQYTATII